MSPIAPASLHRTARHLVTEALALADYAFRPRRRRQALDHLCAVFPALPDRARGRLARGSCRQRRLALAAARDAHTTDPVTFCRRLTLDGWETVHDAGNGGLLLFSFPDPLRPVLHRTLSLYRDGAASLAASDGVARAVGPTLGADAARDILEAGGTVESGVTGWLGRGRGTTTFLGLRTRFDPTPAWLARETAVPALIASGSATFAGWTLRFTGPLRPRSEESSEGLARRYLEALEAAIRPHPATIPWLWLPEAMS
jgi:lauroyl/myristoyl acyltransferase